MTQSPKIDGPILLHNLHNMGGRVGGKVGGVSSNIPTFRNILQHFPTEPESSGTQREARSRGSHEAGGHEAGGQVQHFKILQYLQFSASEIGIKRNSSEL